MSRMLVRKGLWPLFLSLLMLLGSSIHALGQQSLEETALSIVQRHYYDGLPYAPVHELGEEAVPYLLSLMGDSEARQYWVNAIVALGFIESSEALRPLISFLESAQGEVDGHTFRALLSIPFAIGCIASNGDDEALQYLMDRTSWDGNRDLSWTFRGKDIGLLMAEKSAIGLAISGRTDAGDHLRDLSESVTQSDMRQRERFLRTIDGAEDALQKIRDKSRAGYFDGNR